MRSRRGQALVEFALTLPVLLGLLVGVLDLGFLFHRQLVLADAAREGARLGSLGQTTSQVQGAVIANLGKAGFKPLPAAGAVKVELLAGTSAVTIDATIPLLFGSSGPPVPLRAATRMRLE